MNRRRFLSIGLKAAAVAPVAGIAAIALPKQANPFFSLKGDCEVDGIALLRHGRILAKTKFRSPRALVEGDELTTHWGVGPRPGQKNILTVPRDFGITHLTRKPDPLKKLFAPLFEGRKELNG